MDTFDVVIIGSGPGGYVCAIRCAQLGLKTALIEKYSTFGGTCLNVGCIPSKAMLDSSEKYYELKHKFKDHGINVSDVQLDFSKFLSRVKSVVKQTCDGIQYLMKKNKITTIQGIGSFIDTAHLKITSQSGERQIAFKNCIIATGSKPSSLPNVKIDKQRIITSTEALSLKEIPHHLIVIGGGVIGLELGSVYSKLGSRVSVVEYADSIIPTMDHSLSKELQKVMQKEGMNFYIKHAVKTVNNTGSGVSVTGDNTEGKPFELAGDYCLMSVGRRPFTTGLGLEALGIQPEKNGTIPVNNNLQTKHPNIYAIGDVVKGPMLAHKAEEEGVYVAEFISGQKPHIDYNLIPGVVYTWPEVASVGPTENDLKKLKIPYKVGQFPFKASGRARASNESDGFIKVLSHQISDEILAIHMIGPRAADMIAQGVIAMEFKASAEDLARMSFAHPTYSESVKEACLHAGLGKPLHL